jgi:hypothetical protein
MEMGQEVMALIGVRLIIAPSLWMFGSGVCPSATSVGRFHPAFADGGDDAQRHRRMASRRCSVGPICISISSNMSSGIERCKARSRVDLWWS